MNGSGKTQLLINPVNPNPHNNCYINREYSSYLLKPTCKHNYINNSNDNLISQIHSDCLIQPTCKPNYITSPKELYLKVDNFLSEYNTLEKQMQVIKNLGIEGLSYWGNIRGYVEDQLDLIEYIKTNNSGLTEVLQTSVQQQIKEASKQIKYNLENPDFNLNEDFNNAVKSVLSGKTLNSIDDAIRVIMYKLFPITYTNYTLTITDTASKSYTIEKGTAKSVNLNDNLGNITITIIPGNKKDQLISLKFDNIELLNQNELVYSIPIKFSDLTQQTSLSDNVNKIFNITLNTDLPYSIQEDIQISITINKQQYYFQETYDEYQSISTYVPSQQSKNTDNTKTFNLYSNKKYLSVFAPKNITKVETATSIDGINWGGFSITTGYHKEKVNYTPNGGTTQTYYRITLDSKQSNHVKIRIT